MNNNYQKYMNLVIFYLSIYNLFGYSSVVYQCISKVNLRFFLLSFLCVSSHLNNIVITFLTHFSVLLHTSIISTNYFFVHTVRPHIHIFTKYTYFQLITSYVTSILQERGVLWVKGSPRMTAYIISELVKLVQTLSVHPTRMLTSLEDSTTCNCTAK